MTQEPQYQYQNQYQTQYPNQYQNQYPSSPAGSPPPAGGPPWQPPQRPGYNGFAIASGVLSLFGGVLLSVIFGFVALNQIRKTGQKGKGFAIAGLVISALWVVAIGIGIALAIAATPDRDSAGNVTSGGDVSATQLRAGDCIRDMKESEQIYNLPAVPCTQPHQGEVFAVFTLPAGDFPGAQKAANQAEKGCQSRLEGYSKKAARNEKLEMFYLYPSTAASWGQDRGVTCIITDPSGKLTKSLKD